MCFSAEASFGVAVALLPVGAYSLAAAWQKDRAYLPLAAAPTLFGLQQLCEGVVWVGLGRGDPEMIRVGSLGFLFFALALWPVWVPLAVAAIERRGWRAWVLVALAGGGLAHAVAFYVPATDVGGLNPTAVGHSIRYDFSAVPAAQSPLGWLWPVVYVAAVCVPLLLARDRHLRSLGVAVAGAAVVSYAAFEHAFASVWCFFAAVLSAYLAYVLNRLPDRSRAGTAM